MKSFKKYYISLSLILVSIILVITWVGNERVSQEVLLSKALESSIALNWLLAVVIFVFVCSLYFMLNKTLIAPLARLSLALNSDLKSQEVEALPQQKYTETQALMDAFIYLRKQVEKSQAELKHQSMHDNVTGLPNRGLFLDRLSQLLKDSQRNHISPGVIILNVERIKEINNTLGHCFGDTLLQDVGARISSVLRDFDSVSRLGGGEFGILLHNVGADGVEIVAEKISTAMTLAFQIESHQLLIGCNQGIALHPEHGKNKTDLIKHANIALHTAKSGHLKHVIYNASEDNSSVSNISLAADLKRAINHNELQLFYQPKVNSCDGVVVGVEALLRWIHPVKGFIPPEQIIMSAEQSGLIHPLTEWVINTAVSQTDKWLKNGIHIGVAVNLSAYNLQNPHLVSVVNGLLENSALKPRQLIFEITESAMMENPKLAAEVLTSFDNMGLKIAIDDFGTGYSSLAYLKNLPVHELKIDRSFVMNIVTDKSDFSIVKSTIDLAHNLGLSVVAEGVEDQSSWDILDSLGCDTIQGYFISKPIPVPEFEKWYAGYSQSLKE